MNKDNKIGIDSVRLWAFDKTEEINTSIETLDLSNIEHKNKINKSFLLGMIEAFRLVDEEIFENNRCNDFYIKKSKEYQKQSLE